MEKITLFHGTSNRIVVPTYGLGEKKHDYGMGFYLTDLNEKLNSGFGPNARVNSI